MFFIICTYKLYVNGHDHAGNTNAETIKGICRDNNGYIYIRWLSNYLFIRIDTNQ